MTPITTEQFLSLFPNTVIRYIDDNKDTKRPPKTPTVFNAADIPDGYGAFFTVNGFHGNDKHEANLSNVNGVQVDIDRPIEEQELFELVSSDLPPTIINRTKNGYHVVWLLMEPINVSGDATSLIVTVKGINRTICERYDGDKAAIDTARLLRIPGTEHRKDPADPFVIKTISYKEGNRYTLDELIDTFPPKVVEERPRVLGVAPHGALEEMLKKPKVKALWEGDTSGHENDESSADMALCMHLAWWLKNDKEAMRQAWLSSPLGQREKTQSRKDYQETTINKAISLTTFIPGRGNLGNEVGLATVDSTATRDEYRSFFAVCDFSEPKDVKKLKALAERYALRFHEYFALKHPHLLYEQGQDKVYWEYDTESGTYTEQTGVTVRGWVHSLLIEEGLETSATESFTVNCLARYRGVYQARGVAYDSFDTVDHWFHAKNGWVNLNTGVLEPHTPDRLSRRVSAVSFDPEAKCPLYDRFLDVDIALSEDKVRVLDQFSGLLLTPDITHQKMLTLIGRPGSGKSTLLDIWSHILGDFSVQRRLTDLAGDGFRFAGGGLVGRTLCWFDEVDVKRAEMGNVLGTLITGQKINVERKGINNITSSKNTLKCVLTANSLPLSAEHGIYRRLILIQLSRSFYEDGTANTRLTEELMNEASGIFNRMLRGYHDLTKMRGFTVISGHEELIEQYKAESNVISEFLDEYFVPADEDSKIESRKIYESYRAFTGDRIFTTLTPQRFGRMLYSQPLIKFSKISSIQSHGVRYWTGLRLKDEYRFSENDGFLIKIVDNSGYHFEP